MNDARYWARVLLPEITRLTGKRYAELQKGLDTIAEGKAVETAVGFLQDFHRLLQDAQYEITAAKKSPWRR